MTTISLESSTPPTPRASLPRWAISTSTRPGWRRRCAGEAPVPRLPLHDAMAGGGARRAAGSTAGLDQGASRSRGQGRAAGTLTAELQGRAGERRPRPACRKRRIRAIPPLNEPPSGKIRHAVHRLRARHGRIRSCGSSSVACRTMWAPRPTRRSPRSSASPRFVSTSGLRPPIASRCTAASRPTCSTPMAAGRRRAWRSSCSNCPPPASKARSRAPTTNRDGRTDAPLIAGRPLPIARYELRFHVAATFARSPRRRRSAVPRYGAGAVRGRRAGGPLPCALAGRRGAIRPIAAVDDRAGLIGE